VLHVAEDGGDGRGRRLVAAANVAPGETLLSLPRDACFVDDEVPLRWFATCLCSCSHGCLFCDKGMVARVASGV